MRCRAKREKRLDASGTDALVRDEEAEDEESGEEDDGNDDAEAVVAGDGEDDDSSAVNTKVSSSSTALQPGTAPGSSLEVRPSIQIQTDHASWATFEAYLEDYKPRTWQRIKIKFTSNVANRNKELLASVEGKKGNVELIPDSLVYFKRRTHGSKVKSRSTGARPRRTLRFTNCKYKFTASVVHKRTSGAAGAWVVVVHHVHDVHNHPLSDKIYRNYCERRVVQLNDPIVKDVQLMLRAGGRSGRIYDYLRENSGRQVVMKDVNNL